MISDTSLRATEFEPADSRPFAAEPAEAAPRISRHWFRRSIAVDLEPDASPVTIADRDIEAFIRNRMAATYPQHGTFGEESGRERCDADFVWVTDPVDGTRNFINGGPLGMNSDGRVMAAASPALHAETLAAMVEA
jgi:fructose-1,6-bisphosphatase/inositol monophosphatase family enzyme